jgi:hypothetical protein
VIDFEKSITWATMKTKAGGKIIPNMLGL